ncbi:MAG: oligosaccharide flippase family protein [Alphaproteobacteria bacterium]
MKSIIARIRRSSFIKNVAILVSGTAVGQAIIVLAAPVLSRLYSPTAFGVMSVVLAVTGPIAMMASLKYELAIVLAKNEKDASNLFILAGGLVIVTSLVTMLAMPFIAEWLAFEMERPTAAPLMLWIPALVLFQGLFNVVIFWANRRKDYFWTSAAAVGRSASMTAVQIILGIADRGAKGLIVGRVIGVALATVILGVQTLKNDWRSVLRCFDGKRMRELAREHDHFPKYNAPREAIVVASASVPTFFLAMLFTPAAAGLYWFTVRLLEVPTTLIGIAVRRVFFERATRAFHDGEQIYPLLAKTTAVLAVLGIFPVLVISIEGPDLFGFAFGEEWRGAGIYARWLTIWWFSSFCNVASSALIPIFRLQPLFLGIEFVGLILRSGAIALAVFFGDDVLAIALYSIVGFLLNVYRIGYVWQFAKHKQGTLAV